MNLHHNYRCVKSVNNVNLANFNTGDVPFEFKSSMAGEHYDLLNSFMAVRLRIEQNATGNVGSNVNCTPLVPIGVAQTPDFIAFLCKNPIGVLFSGGRVAINEKNISNVTQLGPATTLYRSAFDSEQYQKTIDKSNAINPLSLDDISFNIGVLEDADYKYTGITKYASKNRGMFKYYMENDIVGAVPLSLFLGCSDILPPDNKVQFSLTIDPYFYTNLIRTSYGMGPATAIRNIVKISSNFSTPAHSIGVGVVDISLYLKVLTRQNPVDEVRLLNIRQIYAQPHTLLGGNESFSVTCPSRNIKYVLTCFIPSAHNGTNRNPNDFSDGWDYATNTISTGGAASNLLSLSINYQGKMYPQFPYTLSERVQNVSSSQLARVFSEVMNSTNMREDRAGALYDESKFAVEPFFVFPIASYPNSDDNNMMVMVNLNTGGATPYVASQSEIIIVCLYDEQISIEYGKDGKVKETILIA